jgi:hypothetical protein
MQLTRQRFMSELWNKLHDATLVSVRLDWETGTAVLALRTGLPEAPDVTVTAEGTAHLRCPRRLPWGESVSINEVRGPVAHENGSRLEIEMQSGDVLEVEARSMTCAPSSAT